MKRQMGFHADPQPKTVEERLAEAAEWQRLESITAISGYIFAENADESPDEEIQKIKIHH